MSKFSVRKPITIVVAVVLVIVLGVVSFIKMTPDLMPNMDMPYVVVMTAYPGATPEKVEDEISKPMEQSLSTLENIKNVESISSANFSLIILEFNNKVNMDTVSVDILQNTNLISYDWDDKIGSPTILKINPSMIPVNLSTVSMKGMDNAELSAFVEDTLLNKLEGTDGVASIDESGILKAQINVVIDQDKIDAINNKMLGTVNGELAKASKKLQDGRKKLNSADSELKSKKKDYESKKDDAYDQLADATAKLDAAQAQAASVATQVQILEGTKQAIEAQLESGLLDPATQMQLQAKLADVEGQLAALGKTGKEMKETMDQLQDAYKQAQRGSYEAMEQFKSVDTQLNNAQTTIDSSKKQLDDAMDQLNDSRDEALKKADLGEALTMDAVSQMLAAQNFDMPAGYTNIGDTKYLVSVGDQVKSLKGIKNLVLFDTGVKEIGTIRVSDVADVFKSDNSADIYAKINGEDGILLSFNKQSNYATAEVCDNIADKFEELEKEYKGLNFESMMDQGYYIHIVIGSILQALALGALFAIIILALFLRDWRPTVIVLFAIPISLIFAIVCMYFSGVTLNMISLSGLAVAVGMLVDNSIVVIENTMRLRQQGISAPKAAIAGAKQVFAAITASTLTTICVFVPIIFTDGITRQMFTDMALTIAYALLASLLVAMTLVPAMAASLLENVEIKEQKKFEGFKAKYRNVLGWSLKHKALVLVFALIMLGGSVGLCVVKGFTFIPEMTSPQMQVMIEMPEGSETKDTMEMTDKVADVVMDVEEVEQVGAMLSNGSSYGLSSGQESSNATSSLLYINCNEKMKRSSQEIADEINEKCKNFDAEITAAGGSSIMTTYMDGMGGSGVSITVYGEDTDELQAEANKIGKIMKKVDGITEVDDGVEDTDPEIHFVVDKQKAAKKGLTVAQVYQEVYKALTKENNATTITWQGDEYDVVVKGENSDKLTPKFIKNYKFTAKKQDGTEVIVKLKDICEIQDTTTLHAISRHNQRTYLTVSGTIDEDHNVTKVTEAVEKKIKSDYKEPKGITWESSGLAETIYDAMEDLLLMMLVGIILIYLIMVAQFQSFLSPFIIMFTIPLAFTGGLLGLLITGKEISVIAMIGFVMLAGIIVNNGIVLVDFINQLRAEGYSKRDAIIEAGMNRIRPVLMTALTTVMGLSVMAVGKTAGTDMMQPVAIVCIGGLLYATVLTLVVVPVMYDILNGEKYKHRKAADLDVSNIMIADNGENLDVEMLNELEGDVIPSSDETPSEEAEDITGEVPDIDETDLEPEPDPGVWGDEEEK